MGSTRQGDAAIRPRVRTARKLDRNEQAGHAADRAVAVVKTTIASDMNGNSVVWGGRDRDRPQFPDGRQDKAIPYKITWEPGGFYKKYHGTVSGEDLLRSLREMIGDPRIGKLRYGIADYLQVTDLAVTDHDLESFEVMEAEAARANRTIFIAVVSDDERLIELLGRTYLTRPVVTYPSVSAARAGVQRHLAANQASRPS
jgi:hypothetical protein